MVWPAGVPEDNCPPTTRSLEEAQPVNAENFRPPVAPAANHFWQKSFVLPAHHLTEESWQDVVEAIVGRPLLFQ